MYWYVLFTLTGREEIVIQLLKKRLDTKIYKPIIPKVETILRNSRQIKKEIKPMFPGYVFIESEASSLEIIEDMRSIISDSKNIIRFLQYDNSIDIAMRKDEKKMLLGLCNDDHCIESSSGIIIGTRVYIKEGPLIGLESIIKKIDRHKRRAVIELDFMGSVRQVNVALEIVEKI